MLHQHSGHPLHDVERIVGALGDLEQPVPAVGEVEHPQHGHLVGTDVAQTTHCSVQPASPKLWLAFRVGVEIRLVVLQHVENIQRDGQGIGQRCRVNEIEVVSRGVVLRILPVRGPHQAADGQVESRRAILPLIVTVR